jgi:hypothetical protein
MRAASDGNDLGWPSEDYPLPSAATRSDWVFVLAHLDRWG